MSETSPEFTDHSTPAALRELHEAAVAAPVLEPGEAPQRPKYAVESLPAEQRTGLSSPLAVCRVTLPSGPWVDLRDVRSLKSGDKKRVLALVDQGRTAGRVGVDVLDGVLAMLILAWSLPYPVPAESKDLASLDELEIGDYDELSDHPVVVEAVSRLTGVTTPNPDEPSADPASPRRPFGA